VIKDKQAMHRHGPLCQEVKVVSFNKAIADWKAGELRWQRVA
jgi:hypothetical protein